MRGQLYSQRRLIYFISEGSSKEEGRQGGEVSHTDCYILVVLRSHRPIADGSEINLGNRYVLLLVLVGQTLT